MLFIPFSGEGRVPRTEESAVDRLVGEAAEKLAADPAFKGRVDAAVAEYVEKNLAKEVERRASDIVAGYLREYFRDGYGSRPDPGPGSKLVREAVDAREDVIRKGVEEAAEAVLRNESSYLAPVKAYVEHVFAKLAESAVGRAIATHKRREAAAAKKAKK